ncbi:MAG: tetratricopeptide repeat protein [Caldimonas sp.]
MLLGERSEEGERLRNRGGSVAAVLLIVVGLLVALGYGRIVLALLAAAAIVIAVVAAAIVWNERKVWAGLSVRARRLPPLVAALIATGRRRAGGVQWRVLRLPSRRRLAAAVSQLRRQPIWPRWTAATGAAEEELTAEQVAAWPVRPTAATAPPPASARPPVRLEGLLPALERRIGQAARKAGLPAAESWPSDSERVANRLALGRNALGMQLRRVGEPAEAVEQHRTARALFAAAGNRRGEALAANSLALALADAGDEQAALAAFEQARALLRALGDREHEGKVLANIGIVKQRVGAVEEAAELLQTALSKLEPETPAYRLVERQMRHAS